MRSISYSVLLEVVMYAINDHKDVIFVCYCEFMKYDVRLLITNFILQKKKKQEAFSLGGLFVFRLLFDFAVYSDNLFASMLVNSRKYLILHIRSER